MAFQTDLETDRDNVFLNTDEFGESLTYRVASTDASSTITGVVQDQGDTPFDDGIVVEISAAAVAAPVKGDQITRASGDPYTVMFIDSQPPMFVLTCLHAEEIA